MKILAIYRHYWPDTTPYARLLRLILEHLVEEGHSATVIAAQPSYNDLQQNQVAWKQTIGGVKVERVALLPERKTWRLARFLNAVLFLFRSLIHAVFICRYDLIVANAHPPVVIGLALRMICWLTGARYILHLQDIHPESLATIGAMGRGTKYRWLRSLDTQNCQQAERLVTLSRDMLQSLEERGIGRDRIEIINNCPLPSFENVSPNVASVEGTASSNQRPETIVKNPVAPSDRTTFLFAGNLGRFQALPELVDGVLTASHVDQLRLVLMGTGALQEKLENRSQFDTSQQRLVEFLGRHPLEAAHAAMAEADYGVVSLDQNVIRYAYPSKTMAYLAVGCPLLAIVDPTSELAQMIEQHHLGIVARDMSSGAIAEAFDAAVERRGEFTPTRRAEISRFAEETFGEQRMLNAWSQLIRSLEESSLSNSVTPESRAAA